MRYLAADFGAGSGRIIVGKIENKVLQLEEVHRFENRQYTHSGTLYWDFSYLFNELKKGIKKATRKYNDIAGIGVDTWGVDFGLIDDAGKLLEDPVCYRDKRTEGIFQDAFGKIEKHFLYTKTGTQIMEINTAFQLLSMKVNNHVHLSQASTLLFMPDLFNYFLTGTRKNEYTIASTSSLLNAKSKEWDKDVFDAFDLPADIMGNIVFPGSKIGTLSDMLCKELNCYPIDVFAVGAHDTASAAAVTFSEGTDTAFLSSGTWSLMGVYLDEPVLSENAMLADLTNEGGIAGKILLLKNITGMWMLQCVMKEWEAQNRHKDFAALLDEAATAAPFIALVDPDDKAFLNPENMCIAIQNYCRQTGQQIPERDGEYVRIILESLALKYKETLDLIRQCTGKEIARIHIVGGGSQNKFLNRLTANATGLPVTAGPVEATAIGNLMVQAIAQKEVRDIKEASEIISGSFNVEKYFPQNGQHWNDKKFPDKKNILL